MLQEEHWRWGGFPNSKITTVYCTWRCTKWIRRLIRFSACPLHHYTGYPMNPDSLDNKTLYILDSGGGRVVAHWGPHPVPCWALWCAVINPAAKSSAYYGQWTCYCFRSLKYDLTPSYFSRTTPSSSLRPCNMDVISSPPFFCNLSGYQSCKTALSINPVPPAGGLTWARLGSQHQCIIPPLDIGSPVQTCPVLPPLLLPERPSD